MNHRVCAALCLAVSSTLITLLLSSCGLIIPRDPHDTSGASGDDSTPSQTSAFENSSSDDTALLGSSTSDNGETSREYRPIEVVDNLPAAEAYLAALPEWDFDGVAVNIVATDIASISPDSTDDVVYNARLERNVMVADKYNTIVMVTPAAAGTIYEQLRTSQKADDYYADIVALPSNQVGRFAAEGLLMNMLSLPFTDYSAPYYNQKAMEQLTVGHTLWGASGDFNENIEYIYGLFFNRDLAEELGYDLYGKVYDDRWSWESMRRAIKAAANVDGVSGYGSSLDINTQIDVMFASSGVDLYDCEWGKLPSLAYGKTKSASSIADKTVRAIRNILIADGTRYTASNAMEVFCDGDMLFYAERLFFASWISDMAANWGLLPFPDAGNGYHSFASTEQTVLCVPSGSANVEQTGLFLQAANAASYGWLDDVFYQSLEAKVIRDADTLNMLDILTGRRDGSVTTSFAYMFGGSYREIADMSYGALYSAVKENYSLSSYYTLYAEKCDTAMSKLFEIR